MYRLVYILLLALCLISCNPISDARKTLVEADSLRSVGVLYSDSSTIAKTAATYGRWPVYSIYPAEYAKANYYYGRLLLERNHHSDAMTCFINASHTDPQMPWFKRVGATFRTVSPQEYSLLGNTYCNIGTICHLAGDFQLSYDIFSLSAEKFKQANNTTAYFYALNDMAIEAAKLCRKDESLALLCQIDTTIIDDYTSALINLTKAILYKNLQVYDSALYYANSELNIIKREPTGMIIKAQSFSLLNQKDSAVIYAKEIINGNSSLENLDNAYYILQHDDIHIDKDSINQLAADRTDVLTLIEAYHISLAQSVHLLIQDINRKPNYKGWAVLIAILSSIVISTILIATWKRKLSKKIMVERQQTAVLIQNKKKELSEMIDAEIQKKNKLYMDNTQLTRENSLLQQQKAEYKEENMRYFLKNYNCFKQHDDLLNKICWKDYDTMCQILDKHFLFFISKLTQQYYLSEQEIRLCVLVLFEYNPEQISTILHYAYNGVGKLKYRVAKKLGTSSKNLRELLIENAVN